MSQARRFHGACPQRVAEAKKALLGWQKPTYQLNNKNKTKQNQKGTLHREHIFVRERGQNPKNLTW